MTAARSTCLTVSNRSILFIQVIYLEKDSGVVIPRGAVG